MMNRDLGNEKKSKYVWLFTLFLLVPILTGSPPDNKAAIMFWLSFISMGIGGSLSLYYLITSIDKMKITVTSGELQIDYSIGKIKIPVSIIKNVETVDLLGKMIRVGGVSLPGIIDIGYYYEEKLGRVKAFLTRKTDLLLITLKNNAKVIISPDNPEFLKEQLKNMLGTGEEKPIKVESRDSLVKGIAIIVLFITLLISANIYQGLPDKIPISFDSQWQPREYGTKTGLMGIIVVLLVFNMILFIVGDRLSRSFPGFFITIVPFIIGMNFMLLSILYLIQWYTQT